MTTYIKVSTKEYPLYEGDIRLVYPDIPEHLTSQNFPCPEDYAEVVVILPDYNPDTHTIQEISPVEINGVWYAQFSEPIPFTQAQLDEIHSQSNGGFEPPLPITSSGGIPNVIA